MPKEANTRPESGEEYQADLLRERIYATFALLAVLISIDSHHSTARHAMFLTFGAIISLWAASIVSSLMARRIVLQGNVDHSQERAFQIRLHMPMLASLVLPMLMIGLSMVTPLTLSLAINISIGGAILLLFSWSILSAHAIKAKKFPTFILVLAELGLCIGIVALKLIFAH